MRTLHAGLRVSDLQRSLVCYQAVGYTVIGTVEETSHGTLSMLQLPGDPYVTVEPVQDPARAMPTPAKCGHRPVGCVPVGVLGWAG